MTAYRPRIDPKLDLVLERTVDVPRELVWKAYTQPEHLMKWFCPLPWKTIECDIDLRVGGVFRTVMQGPDGQTSPNTGCYLEVIENERLTWTNCMSGGFRPRGEGDFCGDPSSMMFQFTAIISLESAGPDGKSCKYTATVIHGDEKSAKHHDEMGFQEGWNAAFDQLVALAKTW